MRQSRMKLAVLSAIVSGMFLPVGVFAAEADILRRVEELTKELEQLKAQVKANQENAKKEVTTQVTKEIKRVGDKSLGQWLTVGGDYQFRIDSLHGETKPFTDVSAVFANAQNQLQGAFFSNPTPETGAMLTGLMNFAGGMAGVRTFDQAQAFLGANMAMMGGLQSFAGPAFVDAYKPKNNITYTNKFGLDLGMHVTDNVSMTVKLGMYKVFGSQSESSVVNAGSAPFFADRVGVFDGTLGHVPSSSYLNVDRAYATWKNLGPQEDIWFSVGRRPATDGAPTNFKYNRPRPGNGGTPALLVDYAFDGMTLGYAPELESLPGFYAKICYGRGFESGFSTPHGNSLDDTDVLGVAVVPVDTEALRVWLQWNRGMKIFDAPQMSNTYFGNTAPKINLGDIDWYGVGMMSTVDLGGGKLNYFADLGLSVTHPNSNVSSQFGFQGLMTGGFFNPEAPTSKTGGAILMGVRYDLPSNTKIGLEYNHGSKNWITFAPSASDMWTSKVGARGNVYDAYVIHEFEDTARASRAAKTFFRFGVQYYDFKYTGSNNWVGAPMKMSDVNGQMMPTTPLSKAYDVYGTLEVRF